MLVTWAATLAGAVSSEPRAAAADLAVVVGGGAAITCVPLWLALRRPGARSTRVVIACAQALWSALLFHLGGGRFDAHLHAFASLALLALYRDPWVLLPATALIGGAQLLHGLHGAATIGPLGAGEIAGIAGADPWRLGPQIGGFVVVAALLFLHGVRTRRALLGLCRRQIMIAEALGRRGRWERLAALSQLAAHVGHRLQGPLAAIRGAGAELRDGELDERRQDLLAVIEREVDAGTRLARDLLDFARVRAPARAPCPLAPLVAEVLGLCSRRDGVEIAAVIDEAAIADLDRAQMREALHRLIEVAIASIDEGRPGRIEIGAYGDAHGVRLTIKDDGAGIPTEDQSQIFEPLFRAGAPAAGLGLPIAAAIVRRHGGTLRVDSEVGVGTRFTIDLPAASTAGLGETS